jgi:hypothetical protein
MTSRHRDQAMRVDQPMPEIEKAPVPSLKIVAIRGVRVILDSDLAELYGVATRVLLQAVRRNLERFPSDFMITLDNQELGRLRSQIVISNAPRRGGRRYSTCAFTEHGAVMAATVLQSSRAIAVSILVVRAFVAMRESLAAHSDMGRRLDALEKRVTERLGTHDQAIAEILEALRLLMTPPATAPSRGIGFVR